MKLTCLRHGLTPLNQAHRFNGSIQEGLTADECRRAYPDAFEAFAVLDKNTLSPAARAAPSPLRLKKGTA